MKIDMDEFSSVTKIELVQDTVNSVLLCELLPVICVDWVHVFTLTGERKAIKIDCSVER